MIATVPNFDVGKYISYGVLVAIFGALVMLLYAGWQKPNVRQFTMDQFRVIVGLPAAGLFSFLVIALFQVSGGDIQVNMFGLKFAGAGGPVIMWILAFLAIATMIGTLWDKQRQPPRQMSPSAEPTSEPSENQG